MKFFLKIDILFYVILLGVCVFVLFQSPLAPYAKSVNGIDSSVFIYSAQQILDGQSMYRDVVDHKGPFLYLINIAALFIFDGKFIGIWIFEIISLLVTSIIMYKTARMFADKLSSFLAVVTAILSLVPILIGGNFTEEWSLPYISIALYVFVSYLRDNKPLGIVHLFILSFTFVLVFMMKANLVAIWAGFGIVLVIKWIFEKKYKELIRNLSFVLLFVLLSLLPFFLYFYYKGTLSDAIYLVFKFNIFEYNPRSNTSMLREYFMILSGDFYLSIIPAVTVIYMLFRDKTAINGGILSAFFFTALTSLLGISFRYYLIIFIPLLVIPYAYIFAVIESSIPKAKYACLCIIFMFYNLNATFEQTRNILDNYSERGYGIATISPPTMEILKKIIIQNTEPVDKILVRGGQVSVYLYSNRTCATRFPFCLKDASLSIKYYVKDVEKALPKLIIQGDVVSSPDTFKLDTLLNNKYYLLATDIENVEFWKLKE